MTYDENDNDSDNSTTTIAKATATVTPTTTTYTVAMQNDQEKWQAQCEEASQFNGLNFESYHKYINTPYEMYGKKKIK